MALMRFSSSRRPADGAGWVGDPLRTYCADMVFPQSRRPPTRSRCGHKKHLDEVPLGALDVQSEEKCDGLVPSVHVDWRVDVASNPVVDA